ncbi:trypsin-like serine peptidase [Planobispora takensis]|uniref:Peptidase n=1 Tax=Planobispora takensis TaxID=1367882 RepID=A0A8J3SU78_9ACTN|nr:trypsin-like serine protease [Planobispora takensis]GII00602.1 peptidase [Planobispora takensis]
MLPLALALALIAPASTPAPAAAAPRTPEPISHTVSQDTPSNDITGYWTPSRMSAARPITRRSERPVQSLRKAGAPTALARTVPALPIKGSGQPRNVGKVFFTQGGQNYVCSASVVNSRGRNMLATAAHCVYDVGGWSKNWIFIPAYSYVKGKHNKPFGTWTVSRAVIEPEWARGFDPDFDYSFITVRPLAGRNIANVVGAQGIKWNQPATVSMRIFGYPAELPWNGSRVVSCLQTTELDTVPEAGIANHRFARCTLNGGSSGGPWVSNYSFPTGIGYLVGIQSMKWWDENGVTTWNSSPYLGDRAYALYRKLAG